MCVRECACVCVCVCVCVREFTHTDADTHEMLPRILVDLNGLINMFIGQVTQVSPNI